MSVNYRFLHIFTVAQKFQQKYIRNQCDRSFQSPEGDPEGVHPPPRPPGAAPLLAAPGGLLGVGPPPRFPLGAIFTPWTRNPRRTLIFAISASVPLMRRL